MACLPIDVPAVVVRLLCGCQACQRFPALGLGCSAIAIAWRCRGLNDAHRCFPAVMMAIAAGQSRHHKNCYRYNHEFTHNIRSFRPLRGRRAIPWPYLAILGQMDLLGLEELQIRLMGANALKEQKMPLFDAWAHGKPAALRAISCL